LLTVIDSRDGPPADIAPQRRTTADFAVATPAIPIPFHKLLKVVAIVDGEDRQTRELLDHIAAERFQVEMSNSSSQLIDYFIKNEARVRANAAAVR